MVFIFNNIIIVCYVFNLVTSMLCFLVCLLRVIYEKTEVYMVIESYIWKDWGLYAIESYIWKDWGLYAIESYIWKDWGLDGHWGLYDKRLRFIWLLRVIYEKTEVCMLLRVIYEKTEVYMVTESYIWKDWYLAWLYLIF